MTVSSTTNRNSFTCSGVKEFTFTFKIFAKTDLVVILRDSEGSETTLTLTTDYTVSAGPWPTGGTVTTVKAYTEGTLVIIRELPQTQGADYVENDPFPAETHEEGLDRAVMILQELTEKIARMLIFAKSSSYSELSLPDPVANKYLAWKSDLSGLKNIGIQSEGNLEVTDYIKTLLDDEDAIVALATLGLTAAASEINTVSTHGIDIPSGEIILFEKDTVVMGYILKTDKDDMHIYVTKGSVEGGESGGSDKTGGTWTQPSHGHGAGTYAGPSHSHSLNTGAAVTIVSGTPVGISDGALYSASVGGDDVQALITTDAKAGAVTGTSAAGTTVNTWRTPGRNFTRQERN